MNNTLSQVPLGLIPPAFFVSDAIMVNIVSCFTASVLHNLLR